MPTPPTAFTDEAGRVFDLRIDDAGLARLHGRYRINLFALVRDIEALGATLGDVDRLTEILVALAGPQAVAQGLPTEAALIDNPAFTERTLYAAFRALCAAICERWPGPRLKHALGEGMKVIDRELKQSR